MATVTTITATTTTTGSSIPVVTHRRVTSVLPGRGLVLLPAAAFAVHQLRYTFAYGAHADGVLAAQGHSYLSSLAPWLVLLLCLGAGSFLVRVARAAAGAAERRPRRDFLALWLLASATLTGI